MEQNRVKHSRMSYSTQTIQSNVAPALTCINLTALTCIHPRIIYSLSVKGITVSQEQKICIYPNAAQQNPRPSETQS